VTKCLVFLFVLFLFWFVFKDLFDNLFVRGDSKNELKLATWPRGRQVQSGFFLLFALAICFFFFLMGLFWFCFEPHIQLNSILVK